MRAPVTQNYHSTCQVVSHHIAQCHDAWAIVAPKTELTCHNMSRHASCVIVADYGTKKDDTRVLSLEIVTSMVNRSMMSQLVVRGGKVNVSASLCSLWVLAFHTHALFCYHELYRQ